MTADDPRQLLETFLRATLGGEAKNPRCRYPRRQDISLFADLFLQSLFPDFIRAGVLEARPLQEQSAAFLDTVDQVLQCCVPADRVSAIVVDLVRALPTLQEALESDANAILFGDPAARSRAEVILSYPGFFAIACYRAAHHFWQREVPLFPRLLTEYAHSVTGIDIHPGATIGSAFCIDHGTGVVIGETTIIGERVKIYQGVTLGGLSIDKSLQGVKRHPTIESDVTIYANATILGGNTVIGAGSTIGGNAWLTDSIPPKSTVLPTEKPLIRTRGP